MKRAFTLIELLIVIAIIAILALIAIPNFLEAQTRAKVTRVKADFRTLATAIESYYVDNNAYPLAPKNWKHAEGYWKVYSPGVHLLEGLSTPIAYITDAGFGDIFRDTEEKVWNRVYSYVGVSGAIQHLLTAGPNTPREWRPGNNPPDPLSLPAPFKYNGGGGIVYPTMWMLVNTGPDRVYNDYDVDNSGRKFNMRRSIENRFFWRRAINDGYAPTYDPTNGTISGGNILRLNTGQVE